MARVENIALFDLDGTLCDYEKGLIGQLNKIKHPNEPEITSLAKGEEPEYIRLRRDMITSSSDWWTNLPKFKLGFDVWELADELGYHRVILTQGPRKNPNSWSGKKMWVDKNLGTDTDMIITRDKSLVYGKVLVDDYPGYIEKWLAWRPRGLVIMPANEGNKNYIHNQLIRYDGSNLEDVRKAMSSVKLKE